MVALYRILLQDVNIAATTALQTLDPEGRERALLIGANVIMPTTRYCSQYLLYKGQPCVTDSTGQRRSCLTTGLNLPEKRLDGTNKEPHLNIFSVGNNPSSLSKSLHENGFHFCPFFYQPVLDTKSRKTGSA